MIVQFLWLILTEKHGSERFNIISCNDAQHSRQKLQVKGHLLSMAWRTCGILDSQSPARFLARHWFFFTSWQSLVSETDRETSYITGQSRNVSMLKLCLNVCMFLCCDSMNGWPTDLKCWRRKKILFPEIMGFIRLFGTTYLSEKSSLAENCLLSALNSCGFLKFKLLHAKFSYLVLVPKVRDRH